MGYCFMSTEKIHSLGELTAKHNYNHEKILTLKHGKRLKLRTL